jgi:sortase A
MQPSFVSPPLGGGRPLGALLGDALRRPGGRRGVSVLSLVLFLAGSIMFAYPVGTDLYSRLHQGQLEETFAGAEVAQAYRERRIAVGDGLTTLRIPTLGVEVLVVEGTTPAALRAGAGHYVETPLPGEPGNVGIAGHRTTYGRPLNRMDELRPGDLVELETPFEVFTYRAMEPFDGHPNPWVVAPTQYDVVGQPVDGGSFLTLTTCHPKGSARQRLVMRFELVGAAPVQRTDTA